MCTKNYFYFQFWHTNQRNGNETLVQRSRPWRNTEVSNDKNPPKIKLKKLVKLTGYTYGYIILTHFENKALAMTGNGNQVNLLKLDLKNLWNHCIGNFFLAGFSHLKPLCGGNSDSADELYRNFWSTSTVDRNHTRWS